MASVNLVLKWHLMEKSVNRVLRKDIDFDIEEQFYINMRATLAVYMTLKHFNIPKLSISGQTTFCHVIKNTSAF